MGSMLLALIYLSFIGLGLPDSLLGSSWPVVHLEMGVPMSYAGIVSSVIFAGTVTTSLFSGKLLYRFGTGTITAVSMALAALGLLGFSFSSRFWMLILFGIPYGLGAGGVDSVLNNYVALHYKPQHMSWLHCMWGVGASISPSIMSFALIRLDSWSHGYLIVFILQAILSVVLFFSLPVWKREEQRAVQEDHIDTRPVSFRRIFKIPGAIACFLMFFSSCSLEMTTTLWTSSYLVQHWGYPEKLAAGFASMFYLGITFGRFVNGFLAMKAGDHTLVRLGLSLILVGIIFVFLPFHSVCSLIGFLIIGLGSAPVYPCIIHMTPATFGPENSQGMVGIQMAFAYMGFLITPPVFGVLAGAVSISLLPVFLLGLLALTTTTYVLMVQKQKANLRK